MQYDPASGTVLGNVLIKYPSEGGPPLDAFGGLLGLTQHPETGAIYGIRQTDNHFARELVRIDPYTGDTTLMGNTGLHIASIAFVENGIRVRITRDGTNARIEWAGGTGPYQLESSSDLEAWNLIGDPTSDQSAVVPIGPGELFFRVSGN